jgi:hypothetical protein
MGIVFPDHIRQWLVVKSVFFFYGSASTESLAASVAQDIARYWNAPRVLVPVNGQPYKVHFDVVGYAKPQLAAQEVWYNTNPQNNYFRIEEYSTHDVSFVDDIRSNSGYFKLANLLHTPTTAAHEYGHTLGLDHPALLDIRGKGQPGIMYPRGTVVDAEFQYNPLAQAGDGPMGGTMDAAKRLVLPQDVLSLRLERLNYKNLPAVIGDFTSVFHNRHEAV